MDGFGRVYIVVTNPKYSSRVAFTLLDELKEAFQKEYGTKVASASEESLTRQSKKLFAGFAEK